MESARVRSSEIAVGGLERFIDLSFYSLSYARANFGPFRFILILLRRPVTIFRNKI